MANRDAIGAKGSPFEMDVERGKIIEFARATRSSNGAYGPSEQPVAPLVVGPVTRTAFVRYQGASGDMNPIHHDEEYATAAGFPTPFSVGMFQAGVLATWATDWLGAENVRRFKVRFKEQVWPGDTLTCSGTVTKEYEADGERRV